MLTEIKVLIKKIKLSIINQWEYKQNIISAIIIQIVNLLSMFVFAKILFNYVDTIIGFTFKEMFLYIVIFNTIDMIAGIINPFLDQAIMQNNYLMALTKPINEIIYVFYFNVSYLTFLIISTVFLTIGLFYFNFNINVLNVLLFIVFAILTSLLYHFPKLAIQTLAFKYGRVNYIQWIYNSITYNFQSIPVTIIKKPLRFLFISLTPFVYFIYFDLLILIGKTSYESILLHFILLIGIDILMYFGFKKMYLHNKKHFEGFGG